MAFYSLSENNISDNGAHALFEALEVNQSLQKLEWVPTSIHYFLGGIYVWFKNIVEYKAVEMEQSLESHIWNVSL